MFVTKIYHGCDARPRIWPQKTWKLADMDYGLLYDAFQSFLELDRFGWTIPLNTIRCAQNMSALINIPVMTLTSTMHLLGNFAASVITGHAVEPGRGSVHIWQASSLLLSQVLSDVTPPHSLPRKSAFIAHCLLGKGHFLQALLQTTSQRESDGACV